MDALELYAVADRRGCGCGGGGGGGCVCVGGGLLQTWGQAFIQNFFDWGGVLVTPRGCVSLYTPQWGYLVMGGGVVVQMGGGGGNPPVGGG